MQGSHPLSKGLGTWLGRMAGGGKNDLPTFMFFSNDKVPYFGVACPEPHHPKVGINTLQGSFTF